LPTARRLGAHQLSRRQRPAACAGGIFLAGVQIAAPALVATMVADVALGFLGKASPQLPVLFIGLAVKNLLGLAMLIAVLSYWPHSFSQRFAESIALASACCICRTYRIRKNKWPTRARPRERHRGAGKKPASRDKSRAAAIWWRPWHHERRDAVVLAVARLRLGLARPDGHELDSVTTHPDQLLPVWHNDILIFRVSRWLRP